MPQAQQVDVLVVGGSVAGSATAVGLGKRGLRVTVVDRAEFPREKPCGEGVMPGGARLLDALGVTPELVRRGARPLEGIAYHHGGVEARGRFPGGHTGLCVRRLELDQVMAQLCLSHGVERWEDTVAQSLERRADGWTVGTSRGVVEARFLVGADGRGSWVRRQLGLDGPRHGPHRFGVRQHFQVRRPLPDGFVHVHLCGSHEVYITPQAGHCVNVTVILGKEGMALLRGDLKGGYDRVCRALPTVAALLEGATEASEVVACGPLRVAPRGIVADHALLVGDASGYVDAITGEGVSLALAHADAAVPVIAAALSSGKAGARDLQPYVRAHRSVGWDHVLMTEAVLLAAARPWLMGRVVRALHRKPALFDRLLGVNDGSESVARALLGVGPGLALRMALG